MPWLLSSCAYTKAWTHLQRNANSREGQRGHTSVGGPTVTGDTKLCKAELCKLTALEPVSANDAFGKPAPPRSQK